MDITLFQVNVIADDGGVLQAAIYATSIALIDAGIEVGIYVTTRDSGYVNVGLLLNKNERGRGKMSKRGPF